MTATNVGDIFRSNITGSLYEVKKIQDLMVILETKDRKNQVLTDLSSLPLFYDKEEKRE